MRTVTMLPLPGSTLGMHTGGRPVGVVVLDGVGLLIVEHDAPVEAGEKVSTVPAGQVVPEGGRFLGAAPIYGMLHAVYAHP